MRRIFPTLAATLLLVACGDDPPPLPEVSFTSEGTTVSTRPFLHCNWEMTDCARDNGALARMRVPPGRPVTVAVPGEVAKTPWSVVVQYRTASGEQKEPETVATFVPDERSDYTVQLPDAGDQLQTVEVKQASAMREPGATSEIQLLAKAVWSLQVDSD